MNRRVRRSRLVSAGLAVLLVPGTAAAVPSATAQDLGRSDRPAPAGRIVAAPAELPPGLVQDALVPERAEPVEPLLERSRRGDRAVRELGDDLAQAAVRNDMRPAELRVLLRSDDTVWLDRQGRVYFVDPVPDLPQAGDPLADAVQRGPLLPLGDTFQLHSNPGAKLTIFLDFDGHHVSGTWWNHEEGVMNGFHPGWDPAGDGPAFNPAEQMLVQQVWSYVAEEYAPFNVDVTTQDPGAAALQRSSAEDDVYGTRVLISPSEDAVQKICQGGCTGVAYFAVFDHTLPGGQPAWVFPQKLPSPKNIAQTAAHEAGHNLGLEHDGDELYYYYAGHGIWASIMGRGHDHPVTQWSQGSYPGADNPEDDVQIITSYLGLRADEASDSVTSPSPLRSTGVISTRNDVDAYRLEQCTPGSTVEVKPAALGPNLDVRAALHSTDGTQLAVSAPASGWGDGHTASGMGAQLTVPGQGGTLVLSIDGAGQGSWFAEGYDDYGSLGAYTVRAPGCGPASTPAPPTNRAPDAPAQVEAAARDASAVVFWSAAESYEQPVLDYTVTVYENGRFLFSGTRPGNEYSATALGLTNGRSYTFTVRARNATGLGPESKPSNVVVPQGSSGSAKAPGKVGKPRVKVRGRKATVSWNAARPRGSAVVTYHVDIKPHRGVTDTFVPGHRRKVVLKKLRPGRYQVRVRARNQGTYAKYSGWRRFRVR